VRRLLVLIHGLPRTGQVAQAVLGPAASWGDQEELLAAIVDVLGYINYLLGRAHFPKQAPAKPPKPIPRPGQQAEAEAVEEPITAEELAEALAEFRKAPT
jgi:hypothetical protein